MNTVKKVAFFVIFVIISSYLLLNHLLQWQVVSVPNIIVNNAMFNIFGAEDEAENKKVIQEFERIETYNKIAEEVYVEKDKAIKREIERKLSDCDEIIINDSFDLDWKHLITVDTIRVQQNHRRGILKFAVLDIGTSFIKISSYKYIEKRTKYVDTPQGPQKVEYEVLIGVVNCRRAEFDDPVFKPYYLKKQFEKSAVNAQYMYDTLCTIYTSQRLNEEELVPGGEVISGMIEGTNIKTIRYYNQTQGYWAQKPYGKDWEDNYYWSGCGPTAAAMIFSTLLNDPGIDPYTMGQFFSKKGLRFKEGTAHHCMVVVAEHYGLRSEYFSFNNIEKLAKHLKEGHLISAVVGRNQTDLYRGGGHFVVINGIKNENGKVMVHVTDPAFTNKIGWWDIDIVVKASKNFTAIWK